MAEESLVIGIQPDTRRGARTITRDLDDIKRKAREVEGSTQRMGRQAGQDFNAMGAAVLRVAGALGAAAIAAQGFRTALSEIIRNGDRLRQLEGRFKALTDSATRAGNLIQSAFVIGSQTGAPFEAITESLTRFRIAGDAINATDQQVVQLTENLLKLGQIGGSTTQELTAGAIQLGQGLASGRLQGEELRSVMENLPLVARQLAEGLNVSVGELREMGAAGELTAERVFGALIRGSDDIEQRFSNLPVTVERAANQAATSWTRFTAELDDSLSTSQGLVSTLGQVPGILDEISDALDRQQRAGPGGLSGFMMQLGRGVTGSLFGVDVGALDAARAEALRQSGEGVRPPAPIGHGGTRFAPQQMEIPPGTPLGGRGPVLSGGGSSATKRADEEAVRLLQSMRDRIELLRQEQQLVGATALQEAKLTAQFEKQRMLTELLNAAAKENTTITPSQIEQAKGLADEWERQSVALVRMEEAMRFTIEAQREGEEAAKRHAQAVQQIGNAITGAIQSADSFAEALKNVALQLANIAVQGLQQPDGGILGALFPSLFSATTAAFPTTLAGANLGGLTYARGGAFSGGHQVTPFAHGGVVNRPILFPMAHGAGLMGEAGPEAVMPLRRGPDGRLGVEMNGGRQREAPNISIEQNVTVNGSGLSEGQLTAAVGEALKRDRPNMLREVQQKFMHDGGYLSGAG